MKKFLALLLVLTMVLSMAACGKDTGTDEPVHYTLKSYTTALGTNWNPHTWDTNGDNGIMGYVTAPLAYMTVLDSENGIYQWAFDGAVSVEDVTADHQDDLTKYDVTLPEGQTVEETKEGFVYEIKLRPEMKWEDGTPINADSYVYSMQQLLNPEMKNYRSNLYYAGESAVAGGAKYYYSLDEGVYTPYTSLFATLADAVAAGDVYINCWEFWGAAGYVDADGNECPEYVSITDETAYSADGAGEDEFSGASLYAGYAAYMEVGGGYEAYATVYEANEDMGATYDAVGLYKVDDYTIRYVTQTRLDYNSFLVNCSSNWLVYEDLYEAGKDTSGKLVTTNYNTSIETTKSFGAYRIESLQDGKQMVFVKNENYWRYSEDEATGRLVATTDFLVDGQNVPMYETDTIVIDVMDDDAAKQAFLKGQLNEWTPTADDLPTYAASEQLMKAPESYTQSFFFNCGLDALKTMDESKGNTNSVVLSNYNFRKAFSLAIDRDEYVGATAGWLPAYSMLNDMYHYDIYNDPTSSYRASDPAMQAICNFYGVEYGEGTPYADLKAAYQSINGYNLTEAQNLMKTACDELVAEGLYTAGLPIHIRIGWAKGALTSVDNQQLALMNKYINAAAENSGFGTITLEAVGNIPDRYGDVPAGEYAIGFGAWGGAYLYPFRNFQVYCDPNDYDINEAGCWDPTVETLTLTVEGQQVTKTWQDWSKCMVGSGDMAAKSFETKLQILAGMEENYLKFVYRIPLASTTAVYMMGYQSNEYTPNYNIMYGFGGTELRTYNYTDAEWEAYVAEQGGTLNYE